jgi:hypothetical protein
LDEIMTLIAPKTNILSSEEWDELVALKNAINYDPRTVAPDKMEKFTELMVRSLRQRGG